MSHAFKLLIGMLALLALPALSACNTARGFGQDVQALGRAMSGTAQEVEDDITREPDQPAEAAKPEAPATSRP
jgi:predicted small secreted protein